jgi:hypothetical protein
MSKTQVISPTPYREDYSKSLFECPLCSRLVRAHELVNYINNLEVRDARLFCGKCSRKFNNMGSQEQAEFLRARFETHYGDSQFVYALNDPRTAARRYVGRATDPRRRYTMHLQQARLWKPEKRAYIPDRPERFPNAWRLMDGQWEHVPSSKQWVAELLSAGLKPQLEILEKVEPAVIICEREMRWISQSINEGHELLNAENSFDGIRDFIRKQRIASFLSVELDKLIKAKYPQKLESLLGGRDTGWRRAVLIHTLNKPRPKLKASSPLG